MSNPPLIFDRNALLAHRLRARVIGGEHFLLDTICDRLDDRLADIAREFSNVLDLGSAVGLDERLNAAENAYDLVIAAGILHWINDLPGMLAQIRRALKADGLFMAMFPGGESLKELRQSLEHAEMAATGGLSPRVSPFVDVRDAGALLQRAGFASPVADSELLTVVYENPLALMHDLRTMGETNALSARQKSFTRRAILTEAMAYYEEHFSGENGVAATFELVAMTGWKQGELGN